MRDARLPTLAQWQAALDLAGTGIVLEDVGDLRKHTGYFPAMHRNYRSGFEWYYGPMEEHFDVDSPEGLDGRGHVISCVTHSDMRELACGLAACAVLAQLADGKYYDEEAGCPSDPEVALEEAKAAEEHIKPQKH